MNNIFNLNRFGRLFIKHTAEHYKSYLMSLTVLIGVMILGGSFIVYMINVPFDRGSQSALFMITLLLAGTVFTSTVFADIGDKKKAVASLTLPASHFEKYLIVWIYSYVIFLVVYTISFYLIVLLATNVRHFPGHPAEILNIFTRPVNRIYLLYASLHAIAFYGAIAFDRLHFIKTSFYFFICIVMLIIINKIFLGALFGREIMTTVPFGHVRFTENTGIIDINMAGQPEAYLLPLTAVLALLFWAAAYYRLKEKQV